MLRRNAHVSEISRVKEDTEEISRKIYIFNLAQINKQNKSFAKDTNLSKGSPVSPSGGCWTASCGRCVTNVRTGGAGVRL